MKKIIVALTLLTSITAFGDITPKTLAYVCNRISSGRLTVQCFKAGQNSYLDQLALGACDRISSAEDTISCVKSIANRRDLP